MLNKQEQMNRVTALMMSWVSITKTENDNGLTDINKRSEDFAGRLLNLIYDYELEDLNKIQKNFPGLDLGDRTKALIAFQVTSRTDKAKIIGDLNTIVNKGYQYIFVNGIKFFIISGFPATISVKKKSPSDILHSFDTGRDIIYPRDLISKIAELYDVNLPRFDQIIQLLEHELYPFYFRRQEQGGPVPFQPSKLLFSSASTGTTPQIASIFFTGDLQLPGLKPAATRSKIVKELAQKLEVTTVLLIHGSPSTGKSALAFLLARSLTDAVLWLDCRDVESAQVIEHIASLLTHHAGVAITETLSETFYAIFDSIDTSTCLILNDLPNLAQVYLAKAFAIIFRAASSKGIRLVITSNFLLPADLLHQYGIDHIPYQIPAFEKEDTDAVLASYGASAEEVELFSDVITGSTQGHPLLIQAAGRYLSTKKFEVDESDLVAIFTGHFGPLMEKEIYQRVLENTADEDAKTLLYRLSLVVGNFDNSIISTVSSAAPPINRPGERASQLMGIWIQEVSSGQYQLSPLIKRLSGALDSGTRKEVYGLLGHQIIGKEKISTMEASSAIFYFLTAQENQHAASLLYNVLTKCIGRPTLFFDWGFHLHWYTRPIPKDIPLLFRLQIRALQLQFTLTTKRDTAFLTADLEGMIYAEPSVPLGTALGHMALFQVYSQSDPLRSLTHLAACQRAFLMLQSPSNKVEVPAVDDQLLNSIWFIFSSIHSASDYLSWFKIVEGMTLTSALLNARDNLHYRMAGESIYRNAVLRNERTAEDISALLTWLIETGQERGFPLLSVYALKFKIKYLTRIDYPLNQIETELESSNSLLASSPLFKFLAFDEIARTFYHKDLLDKTRFYLGEINQVAVPPFFSEGLDFLILQTQVTWPADPARSADFAIQALHLALSSDERYIADKAQLFGEAAIGQSNIGNRREALNLYAKGYLFLLDQFTNTDQQKATVIRFGSAAGYLSELLRLGDTPSYGPGKKFVIPTPGFFFRTTEAILEGNNYFDERRFVTAHAICSAYEALDDFMNAKMWAYKCIEVSLSVQDSRFAIILLGYIFYPVTDRQYQQAYSVVQYLESWLAARKNKAAAGDRESAEVSHLAEPIEANDILIYHSIILPATFVLSADIRAGRIKPGEYASAIEAIFDSGTYQLKDQSSYLFARAVFEEILIRGSSVSKITDMFSEHDNPNTAIMRIVTNLLFSTLSDTRIAAIQQMEVLPWLQRNLRQLPSVYRYALVPYLIEFWESIARMHPEDFIELQLLRSKGLKEVESATLNRKIAKLLRVITYHLEISPSDDIQAIIDGTFD